MPPALAWTPARIPGLHGKWLQTAGLVGRGTLLFLLLRLYASSAAPSAPRQLPAPRSKQPYDADKYLPGARDVPTPYGSLRVYEFGDPHAARRVLFLPGISNPCISLAQIAHILAARGCRVMLLDLYGRGFSDAPDAAQVRYDARLYAAQVQFALASSAIKWTDASKGQRFTICGYSLGGALAANFASRFPELVDDVVLIAPGGLLKYAEISLRSKILYSRGWLPDRLLQRLVRWRMTGSGWPFSLPSWPWGAARSASAPPRLDPRALVPHDHAEGDGRAADSKWSTISADCDRAVERQIDEHPGFIPAFMSSMRFAPIYGQDEAWGLIGQRLDAQRALPSRRAAWTPEEQRTEWLGLRSGKVHIVLGETDSIIKAGEVVPRATAALGGADNVHFTIVRGVGHDLAYIKGEAVAQSMLDVWRDHTLP